MFELTGKYGTAKVFTDVCEDEAKDQIRTMLDQPFAENANVRIMPDVHAGKGCTIGTTMRITDKVCPNLVGVDIGCGMYVCRLHLAGKDILNLELLIADLDNTLTRSIPSGRDVNIQPHYNALKFEDDLKQLYCYEHINADYALQSLGSLGGGNHFIELNKDSRGTYYLVVHSGSRHLGVEVATYYQNKAIQAMESAYDTKAALIAQYKAEGRQQEIQAALKTLTAPVIQKDLAYCKGVLFDQYIHDMQIVQEFAKLNRETIVQEIVERWAGSQQTRPDLADSHMWNGLTTPTFVPMFHTVHNYIDIPAVPEEATSVFLGPSNKEMILRKGAVSAMSDELLLIPINMRDGSLICRGKGKPDWNYSAPHGAGRLMSRSKARESLSMDDFRKSMTGIYSTSIVESTIDESPMAYKSIEDITSNIRDTVTILDVLKPIYNFKAH